MNFKINDEDIETGFLMDYRITKNELSFTLQAEEEKEEYFKELALKFPRNSKIEKIVIGVNTYENYTVYNLSGSCDFLSNKANLNFNLQKIR